MPSFFKNAKEDILMIEEDEEQHRNTFICWLFEKKVILMRLGVIVI